MNENNIEKGEKMDFEKIAKENFSTWVDSLSTKDPKKVAELYANSATFLPTVSPDFKKGKDGAESYFEHFLEKNPNGMIVDQETQALSNDTYLHSGMYNFEVDSESGRQTVEARFSFVWKKYDNENWKIIHHHSSVRPL